MADLLPPLNLVAQSSVSVSNGTALFLRTDCRIAISADNPLPDARIRANFPTFVLSHAIPLQKRGTGDPQTAQRGPSTQPGTGSYSDLAPQR